MIQSSHWFLEWKLYQDNDVTRMQALVDKKKVVVTEAAIRDVLWLDDAEGSMSVKRTSWNEFSSAMASVFICLSTYRKFNLSKYIFDSLVRNVDSTSKFYMYPRFLQLPIRKQVGDLLTHTTKYTSPALTQKVFANMRRVGKGFSKVETPLFEGMLVGQEIEDGGDEEEHVQDVTAGDVTLGDDPAAYGEVPTVSQEPSIPSPTPPTQPPQPPQDLPSTSHVQYTPPQAQPQPQPEPQPQQPTGRIIDEMDKDDVVALMDNKEEDKKDEEAKEDEPAEVHEVVDVVTTTKLITEVVTAASEIVIAASTIISAAEPQVLATTITAAPAKVVAAPSRRRKRVVTRDPKEDSTTSSIIPAETKSIDKGKGILDVAIDHVKLKAKEDPDVQRYQAMKRMPQIEAQARKNMMMYLKNVAGFILDYFKAKRRKLDEEVEDLKRHLEIVPDEDDDVYTEATQLARKVPVVDYEIIEINNKPYYRII
nr:hypothetical protein [Tanacetum cinerariifolium]